MKILWVIQRYYPVIGGAEILAKRFVDFLSKNHEVTVLTTTADDIKSFWNKDITKKEMMNFSPYTVNRYDVLTQQDIKYDKSILKLSIITNPPGPFLPKLWEDLVIKKINYDLIITLAYPFDHIIPAYLASKKWKIPIVIIPLLHQEFPHLYLNGLRLTMLHNSDTIIVMTNSEKKMLEEFGIDQNKILVIPPGIDQPKNVIDKQEFKRNKSIPTSAKIILFVGSKAKVKGIINLIEALKPVWEKNPDIFLLLMGPSTKEFEEYLSNQNNKTKKRIVDLGIVDDEQKKSAFSCCDLFVLPSQSESFGMVYLEAWSFSKPVIGCIIPPIVELIENKRDGLLVQFDNVKELSNSIECLLKDENLMHRLGINGKEKSKKFSWNKSCNELEKICIFTKENYKE